MDEPINTEVAKIVGRSGPTELERTSFKRGPKASCGSAGRLQQAAFSERHAARSGDNEMVQDLYID